jgi:hypothetical protein
MIWRLLGRADPDRLVDARLQLHWAAQVVASIGYTFVEEMPAWAHLSLTFEDGRLVSEMASREPSFRAALDPATLEIVLFDGEGEIIESATANNRTLAEAYLWLESAVGRFLDEPVAFKRPDHDLPTHTISSNGRFALRPGKHFHELSSWYHNAKLAIGRVVADFDHASPIRCWPHHFDLASLVSLDPDVDPEHARSFGVGLSPGDAGTDQPYFYVTPWPYPAATDLPPLASGGTWHTLGWTGAILKADRIVEHGTSDAQLAAVEAFLRSATTACNDLLTQTN